MAALSDMDLVNPHVRLVAPEELDVRPIEEQRDTECPRSELLRAGESTGEFVPGIVREAVVAVGSRFLAFMTDDIPYEEFPAICYLECDLSTIEVLRLGAVYSTGSFSELDISDPKRLRFQFIGGITWAWRCSRRRNAAGRSSPIPRSVAKAAFLAARPFAWQAVARGLGSVCLNRCCSCR